MSIVTIHPALVHFPIALLLLGTVTALSYMLRRQPAEMVTCTWWLLLLGWISALAAIVSGLLAQIGLPPRAPYRGVLNWHIGTGMAVAVVYGVVLYTWWLRRPRKGKQSQRLLDDTSARPWLTILLLLGVFLIIASGWNGGKLVYEFGVNVE